MRLTFVSLAAIAALGISACDQATMTSQSYPGRSQYQFMSADQVTVRTYACVPGSSEAETQRRAARAHSYVDSAIRSAYSRLASASGGGMGASLGVRAELNAETVRISREADGDFRCALVNSRAA